MLTVIHRSEAISLGLDRYFTGRPCKYGHIAERFTKWRDCLECHNRRNKEQILRDRSAGKNVNKRQQKFRKNNLEKSRKIWRDWALNNTDYIQARNKKRSHENREYFRHHMALRRARFLQAIPNWSDKQKIKEIYDNCPTGFHVDHIVPLANPVVCGLHVHNNLQYLSPHDNFSKGNSFE